MNDVFAIPDSKESIRILILSLAQALVDDDKGVNVTLSPDGQDAFTVVLTVSQFDLGKVIGKQGRIARSIRTILQAASLKHQRRFSLDIESAASRADI